MLGRWGGYGGTTDPNGSPDDVAEQMATLKNMGIDGIAMGLVNGLDCFPYVRGEVLPRLERMGLRTPAR